LVKGSTAIESFSGWTGRGGSVATAAGFCSSHTAPTKRKPLRSTVRMRRCSSPLSPIALRTALMRVLSADSDTSRPFQIDANFGYTGAVLAMLVTDLPVPAASNATPTVLLGPAIPSAWAGGSVKGLRLRGGGSVDFSWDANGLVTKATLHGRSAAVNVVNMSGRVLAHI